MSKKIVIEIFKDGSIQAETKGIKGKKCKDYDKIIEELLNAKIVNSELTSEYYEEEIENISEVEQR